MTRGENALRAVVGRIFEDISTSLVQKKVKHCRLCIKPFNYFDYFKEEYTSIAN